MPGAQFPSLDTGSVAYTENWKWELLERTLGRAHYIFSFRNRPFFKSIDVAVTQKVADYLE